MPTSIGDLSINVSTNIADVEQSFARLSNSTKAIADAGNSVNTQLAQTSRALTESSHAADRFGLSTVGARRELIVLGHEALQGNFSKIPGSFLVLAERMELTAALFNPITIGFAAVGAAAAVLLVAANHAEQFQRALNGIEAQLTASGRAGAISSQELKSTIGELATLSGVTKEQATQAVTALVQVRQVSEGSFRQLTSIVVDFATAIGKDVPEAAKQLGAAFADPAKGAQELHDKFGLLTSGQVAVIEAMLRVNDATGAQAQLISDLTGRIKGLHDDALTPLQKAEQGVSQSWHELDQTLSSGNGLGFVNERLIFMVGEFKWIIDHAKQVADAVKQATQNPTLQFAAGEGGSGDAIPNAPRATTPTTTAGLSFPHADSADVTAARNLRAANDELVSSGIKVADAFKTEAQRSADLRQTLANLRQDLGAAEQLYGRQSEAYKRIAQGIAGVREQIAKSTPQIRSDQLFAGIEQVAKSAQVILDATYRAQFEALKREQDALEAAHRVGLVSEEEFVDRRGQIAVTGAAALVQKLQGEYQKELAAFDAIVNAPNTGKTAQARQDFDVRQLQEQQKIGAELYKTVIALGSAQDAVTAAIERSSEAYAQLAHQRGEADTASLNAIADYARGLKQQNEDIQFQTSIIGLSAEAQKVLTAQRAIDLDLVQRLIPLQRELARLLSTPGASDVDITRVQQQIATMTLDAATARASIAQAVATQDQIAKQVDALKSVFVSLADAGASFIEDFVQHGTKAFKNLWDNFKSWALSAFAKIAAQTVVVNIAQSFGAGGIASNALAGSNPLGTLLGLGNSASGLAGGGGLLSGLGSVIGGTFGTALSAGFSAGLSTLSIAAGAGVEAIGGIGSALGALSAVALPVAGIVLAAAAAFGLFGKGGGPKSGGFASESTSIASGITLPDANVERFFTPSDSDVTVKTIVDSISATYQKVAKSFGAKLGNAQFALGFDTDPKGKADNRISASASVNGQQVFGVHDVNVGRDNAQLQTELSQAAQRALLAALQASDFPQYIANILDSVDAAAATSDQINAVIATAAAVKQAVDTIAGLGEQFANLDPAAIQSFIESFGGLDQLLSAVSASYQDLYTDAERAADATAKLADVFGQFGENVPKDYKAYRDLLSAIDLTTDAGRQEYATLLQAIPAWAALHGTAQDATDAIDKQTEATKQLVGAATDFYQSHFFSEVEQASSRIDGAWDHVHAAWTQFGDLLIALGYDHIPTTNAGFRQLITDVDAVYGSTSGVHDGLITLAQDIFGLNTDVASLSDAAGSAADGIGAAASQIVDYAAVLQNAFDAADEIVSQTQQQIDTVTQGLNFGDALSTAVQLLTEKYSAAVANFKATTARNGGIVDAPSKRIVDALGGQLRDTTKYYAQFVTLTAQYNSDIAEGLVKLQEQYDQTAPTLASFPSALHAYEIQFNQQWQSIITGTASGVDGTLSELDRLRKGIQDYLDSLRQSDLSPLKPGQKLAEAQSSFQAELAKARAGDAGALGDITKFADTYLKDARDVFASGPAFSDIFNEVETSLRSLLGTGASTVASVDQNSSAAIASALPPSGTLASSSDIASVKSEVSDVREAVAALADVIDSGTARRISSSERIARQRPVPK